MKKEQFAVLIESAFKDIIDSDSSLYNNRIKDMKNIFTVQAAALIRIQEQCFFSTITKSFEDALETFLKMLAGIGECIKALRNTRDTMYALDQPENDPIIKAAEDIEDAVIADVDRFIRSFDNALQGYFNSDRQFLEFPGHHVSLYDLPIKLGTVYVNYINKVSDALGTEVKFSYLLCPEPFEGKGETVIRLLAEKPSIYTHFTRIKLDSSNDTETELCLISVPCSLLFNPSKLCIILTHEIAHYISRKLRCVKKRNSILNGIMAHEFVLAIAQVLTTVLEQFGTDENYAEKILLHIMEQECDINGTRIKYMYAFEERFSECFKKSVEQSIENDKTLLNICSNRHNMAVRQEEMTLQSERECVGNAMSSTLANARELIIELLNQIRTSTADYRFNGIQNKCDNIIKATESEMVVRTNQIFYLLAEAVPDIIAIKTLDVQCSDYCNQINENVSKQSKYNSEQSKALIVRKYIVCKVLGWKPACTPLERQGLDDALLFHSTTYNTLLDYFRTVYDQCAVNDSNEARKMYKSLNAADFLKSIPEYMM